MTASFLPVGTTNKKLLTSVVDTDKHIEAVYAADPEDPLGRAGVKNSTPAEGAYGLTVRLTMDQLLALAPDTSGLTDAELRATPIHVIVDSELTGVPAYQAMASGTINVPAGAKVTVISAHSSAGGTLQIGGGASIPIPATVGFTDDRTPFVGPLAIVGTGTDSMYVGWLT